MATSKTLTPTNVTIQIPAFTDQPDQRVNSNCIDKEADAINALNSNIVQLGERFTDGRTAGTAVNLNDLTTSGLFVYNSSSTNIPSSGHGGTVLVMSNNYGSQVLQIAQANTVLGFYFRNFSNNSWSAWTKI